MKKILVYIPIEIKSREFLAKVILALKLIESGYQVVIGKSTEVEKICRYWKKGIYLGTSIMKQHCQLFHNMRVRGNKIVAIDEEGLIYYNEEDFLKNKVYEQSMNEVDFLMTWGKNHSKLVNKKCKDRQEKIIATGNVRIELLKNKYHYLYENDIKIIKEKYGRYLLINTNLGAYNNIVNSDNYLATAMNLAGGDEDDVKFRIDKIEHQKTIYNHFIKLAEQLAEILPEHKVIIRPHPSEKIEKWEEDINKENVFVIREGNVIPWILGSECVIQQNCTTGIEAMCLKKPVVAFLPDKDMRYDDGLTNKVVPVFEDIDSLIDSIKKICENGKNYYEELQKLSTYDLMNYIENLSNDVDGYEMCKNVISQVSIAPEKIGGINCVRLVYFCYYKLAMILNRKREKYEQISKKKFPHTDKEEWMQIINEAIENLGIDIEKINFNRIADETYIMYSK